MLDEEFTGFLEDTLHKVNILCQVVETWIDGNGGWVQ